MDLLALGRLTLRAGADAVRFGVWTVTLPARVAVRVAGHAAEQVAEALGSDSGSTPPPTVAQVPTADGPAPVAPSFARAPQTRRRASTPAASPTPSPASPRQKPRSAAPAAPRAPEPAVETGRAAEPVSEEPVLAAEPVSEEPVLVAESADEGAEDGAGAQVRIAEPWPNYSKMNAGAVVDRVAAEPEATLSVLLLYERAHRARRSVVAAAERELARR